MNNLKIMEAMNYAYDNPESRDQVKIDTEIVDISMKTVYLLEDAEEMSLWASLSSEEEAYIKSIEALRVAKNIDNGIGKQRTE